MIPLVGALIVVLLRLVLSSLRLASDALMLYSADSEFCFADFTDDSAP